MDKDFPKRLRTLMNEKGITQAALAKRVGIKQQSIQYLLSGNAKGSRYISQIAEILDTSVAYLMNGLEPSSLKSRAQSNNLSAEIQAIVEILQEMPASRVASVREGLSTEKQELDQLFNEMRKIREGKNK